MAPREFMLVEIEPRRGTRHPLVPDMTIGRERCEILLEDEEVSRLHAAIRTSGAGVAIEDLGSRNGTFVNGERVKEARPLADGDAVRIGGTSWRFQTSTVGETTSGVPAPAAAPSAVHGTPAPQPAAPPSFSAPTRRRPGASAARRGGAVLVSYAVVFATAVAVIAYFAAR